MQFSCSADSAFGVLVLEPLGLKWSASSHVKEDLQQNWVRAPQPTAGCEQGIEKQPSVKANTDSVG